jgi:hypothetical protein
VDGKRSSPNLTCVQQQNTSNLTCVQHHTFNAYELVNPLFICIKCLVVILETMLHQPPLIYCSHNCQAFRNVSDTFEKLDNCENNTSKVVYYSFKSDNHAFNSYELLNPLFICIKCIIVILETMLQLLWHIALTIAKLFKMFLTHLKLSTEWRK